MLNSSYNKSNYCCTNSQYIQLSYPIEEPYYYFTINQDNPYITWTNQGILPQYKKGCFSLGSTYIQNDTLYITEPGMYSISLGFDVDITAGDFTGLLPYDSGFQVEDLDGNVIEYLYNGGVAFPNYLNYGALNLKFLYKIDNYTCNNGIRLKLSYFDNIGNFPYTSLQIDTLVLAVEKIN